MSWIQPQGKISTARLDLGKSRSSTADFSVVECKPLGEMAEWPIVQHWKCCVSERAPGVRIPLSPHFIDADCKHRNALQIVLQGVAVCCFKRGSDYLWS